MSDAPSSTGILVAGMHRSGTSATAGALAHFDIALGSRLLAPAPDNPRGYWEHERAVQIHETLLGALGRRWDDVRPLPSDWRGTAAAQTATTAIAELVEEEFAGERLWAVKDPRICRVLPLWLDVLSARRVHPVALFVVRHPDEVAASIEARNGWNRAVGVLLWLRHMGDAIRATDGIARTVLAYPDLVDDPVSALSSALSRLGVEHAAPSPEALRSFVDPRARHHTAGVAPGETTGPFRALALAAYDLFLHVPSDASAWRSLGHLFDEFERLWEGAGGELEGLAAMATTHATRASDTLVELADSRTALAAQIRWSEEAAARLEEARAERDELRSQLTAQVRWSEEAAAQLEVLQAERDEARSQLTAQVRWSEEAAARLEVLQAERDEARSQLTAQVRWSEEAAARLEALQAERDEARSQLIAQVRWSEEAVARLDALRAERDALQQLLADARGQAQAIEGRLHAVQQDAARLASTLDAIYRSRSWRYTQPLRSLAARLGKHN